VYVPVDAVGAHGAGALREPSRAVAAHRVVSGAHGQRHRGPLRAEHAVRGGDFDDRHIGVWQVLGCGVEAAQVHVGAQDGRVCRFCLALYMKYD
jgi:hypothetical protein